MSDAEQLVTRVRELERTVEQLASGAASLLVHTTVLTARATLLLKHAPQITDAELREALEEVVLRLGDRLPIPAEALRVELVRAGNLADTPP